MWDIHSASMIIVLETVREMMVFLPCFTTITTTHSLVVMY